MKARFFGFSVFDFSFCCFFFRLTPKTFFKNIFFFPSCDSLFLFFLVVFLSRSNLLFMTFLFLLKLRVSQIQRNETSVEPIKKTPAPLKKRSAKTPN